MAKTLTQIIADLEKNAELPTEAPAPTPAPAEVPVESQVDENEELRKVAEEYDAAGRIMARGFFDEFQKLAVGVVGITPNTGAEGDNPAVQLSNSDIQVGEVQQVVGAIRQQTQGAEANMSPAGKVQVKADAVSSTAPSVQDNPPVAADAKKAQELAVAEKVSNVEVVERLFNHYFGE